MGRVQRWRGKALRHNVIERAVTFGTKCIALVPRRHDFGSPVGQRPCLTTSTDVRQHVQGSTFRPVHGVWRQSTQRGRQRIAQGGDGVGRWFAPVVLLHSGQQIFGDVVQFHRNWFAVFDVSIGAEMVSHPEVQADRYEVRKRPPFDVGDGSSREDRSHRPGSEADWVGFVVGRTLGEQGSTVTVRDTTREVEQGSSVQVLGFFLGEAAPQQFSLAHNGLDRHASRPEAQDRASHEVVPTADHEVAGVGQHDGKGIHEGVHVPRTAHRTPIVVQTFQPFAGHGLELPTCDNPQQHEGQFGPKWRARDGPVPPWLRHGHQGIQPHLRTRLGQRRQGFTVVIHGAVLADAGHAFTKSCDQAANASSSARPP